MLIRLPSQGGIAAHTLRPFPYPVLWSIDPDVVTIERFNRLNDPKGEQHVLDNLRQIARRRPHTDATTWSFDGYAWIVFFGGTPSWNTIIHESTHAVGLALHHVGALDETKVGSELSAYLIAELACKIGENIAHWHAPQQRKGRAARR